MDNGTDRLSSGASTPVKRVRSDVNTKIDLALLSGLESFISQDEQVYITELMTSGDISKLAQAAHILYEIKRINVTGNHELSQTYFESFFGKAKAMSGAEKRALEMSLSPETCEAMRQRELLPPMPRYVVLKADFDVYA